MRTPKLILLTLVAGLAAPATAAADFQHVVARGESLSSVAAADGLSVADVAAANGLTPSAQLTAGTRLAIPPQGAPAPAAPAAPSDAAAFSPAGAASGAAAPGSGAYVVARGDTLSAIAARYGVGVDQLAAANGLSPNGLLPAGATLSVSGAGAPAGPGSSPGATSAGGPQPTAESVSAADVGSVAAQDGVSPALAEAIAYQESGLNNGLVSRTGATGVMQIEPGTWRYIGQNLGGPVLAPNSATDNIRGGVELLRSLLDQTGGDPAQAAAGYYQGLGSIQDHGVYPGTRHYVNDVMALARRFGGP